MNQLTFLIRFYDLLHYHLSLFVDVYFYVIGVRLVTSFFVLFCCSVGAERD